jgi:hypothetical protein
MKAEGVQVIDCRMGEHDVFLSVVVAGAA